MNEDVFSKPPAHGRIANWLGPQTVARLLDYAQSRRENFFVSGVGHRDNKIIDLTIRRSSKLKDLGHLKDELRQRARAALPAMCAQLGTTPFEPSKFELELVAHGDGAFYTRHRDTNVRQSGLINRRVISAVYYFHRSRKSFSGGAGTFVDIEPTNDTLVFFPSWFPHQVLPVVCPSDRFEGSRFAINCWVHR